MAVTFKSKRKCVTVHWKVGKEIQGAVASVRVASKPTPTEPFGHQVEVSIVPNDGLTTGSANLFYPTNFTGDVVVAVYGSFVSNPVNDASGWEAATLTIGHDTVTVSGADTITAEIRKSAIVGWDTGGQLHGIDVSLFYEDSGGVWHETNVVKNDGSGDLLLPIGFTGAVTVAVQATLSGRETAVLTIP